MDTDLSQPFYSLTEAARYLQVHPSTLRWWLEGRTRVGKIYPPVLREQATGSSDLSWLEFVEAGWLREYRRHLPLRRLRPLIQALREELQVSNPLATRKPYVNGRDLVYRLQDDLDIPEELWIVVGSNQLMLSSASATFFEKVEFDSVTHIAQLYKVHEPVVIDPYRSFGIPTIKGIRAETLSGLALAGEPPEVIVEIYEDYGITEVDIETAVRFDREFMRAAA